jgi:hypothetical protein
MVTTSELRTLHTAAYAAMKRRDSYHGLLMMGGYADEIREASHASHNAQQAYSVGFAAFRRQPGLNIECGHRYSDCECFKRDDI